MLNNDFNLIISFHTFQPTVTLKLRKPKTNKKVAWKTGVVDNEHMGKKKSKCKYSGAVSGNRPRRSCHGN